MRHSTFTPNENTFFPISIIKNNDNTWKVYDIITNQTVIDNVITFETAVQLANEENRKINSK